MKKAIIVLPTYNEAGNIEQVVREIFEQQAKIQKWQLGVLVVDDHSPDKTANIVKSLQKKYPLLSLIEGKKEGLGKAYIRGFAYAINELQADVLFEMDADLQHPPVLIPKLLEQIDKGADIAIGARYIKGGGIPKDWGIHRKIFSIGGNLIVRFGFMNLQVHDWTNGFRALKSSFVKQILNQLEHYNGYIFQIALLDKAIKHKQIIKEIPMKFRERRKGVSKINSPEFIFNIAGYLLQNSSFLKFAIVGLIGFAIDFGISFIAIEKLRFAIWLGTLISTGTAVVSNFTLNNFWSFAHKKIKGSTNFLLSFLKFVTVSLGSISIQTVALQLATNAFGLEFWYIQKVLIIAFLIIPYSYLMYNKFIWNK